MRSPRMRVHSTLSVLLAAVIVTLLFLAVFTARAEAAEPKHHHQHGQQSQPQDDPSQDNSSDGDDSSSDPMPQVQTPSDDGDQPLIAAPPAVDGLSNQGPAQTVQIQLTGYAKADNTPPGSTTISMPVIHQQAGGTCTFKDPTTFASPGSAGSTEFPKGERVYIPKLRCYGISEDSGATAESVKHIDFYTGSGPGSVTGPCEDAFTGPTSVIVNPPATEPALPGPISNETTCRFNKDQTPTTGTSTGADGATHARTGAARSTKHATADTENDDGS